MKRQKPISSGVRLSGIPSSFTNQYIAISLAISVALIVGCSYYKVNTLKPLSEQSLATEMKSKNKYIILHAGEKVWHLENAVVDEISHEITGARTTLPSNHFYYKTAERNRRPNRYDYDSRKRFDNPIYEIHIYSTAPIADENGPVTLPFSSINLVEVYDTHGKQKFGAILGVTAGALVVVGAVLLATKSSCPFAYVRNGDAYDFTGEIYAGAINSGLERDDYLPIPQEKPAGGLYEIRITNELLERQYTNLAQLMIVDHPSDATVIVDKNGVIQSIRCPEAPEHAFSDAGNDQVAQLRAMDSVAYEFDDESPDEDAERSLVLTFQKPVAATSGKLVINARNTYWLDYVYGKFNEQMGSYYNTFAERQKKVPAIKQMQWSLDQSIPLSVFVESPGGWTFVDYFHLVGPLASRDLVMSLDLSAVKGDKVRIKLQSGFMFWAIDYAALDFSENVAVTLTHLHPSSAINENGEDVAGMVSATDKKYLIQNDVGNAVNLRYQAPQSEHAQTAFLHSRGYYEYIRDYHGWPDLVALKAFRKKGEFTRFARSKYDDFAHTDCLLTAVLTETHAN